MLTIAQWAESIGISRQAAYAAIKRCGIPTRQGLVDGKKATAAYRASTRPRMNDRRAVGVAASPRDPKVQARAASGSSLAPAIPTGEELGLLLEAASRMSVAAAHALQAGRFDLVERALREAIAAIPPSAREQLRMPELVWDRLTATVGGSLAGDAAQLDSGEAERMGHFWASVAAGEVRRA